MYFSAGGSVEVTRGQKTWCVPNPMSNESELMSNLEFSCSQVDCHLIQQDAPCFLPNTHFHHAAFAMNLYYQSRGRRRSSCDFNNSGLVSLTDPSSGNCTFQSGGSQAEETSGTWCVAKPEASDDLLQQNIDFACNHVDCSPIQEGGFCYIPVTLINHASFAMNLYFKTTGGNKSSCDFRRTGLTVTSDPNVCVLDTNKA
ncbi:hypothetical protein SLEP1_g6227 [Rubroshorea leprosula]|uniref:X8 domain-containing protein n=1 Tax=Rubroshorea leprosula TaxID=152421 RepID=A0AAV5HUH8_9ROSI|nr:hypothetical protein SLEP1_g6227 [Rubroshorea leprosula]